jgi:hypothetical protein
MAQSIKHGSLKANAFEDMLNPAFALEIFKSVECSSTSIPALEIFLARTFTAGFLKA